MSKRFFIPSSPTITTISLVSLLFNCFSIKLFLDIGNYNILHSLFFFHCIMSMVISITLSSQNPSKKTILISYLHSLTALPAVGLICLQGVLSIAQLMIYFIFIFSLILSIHFMLRATRKEKPAFYTLIIISFLWGTSMVIESIPLMYDMIAPLTISYHYSLITDGVFHISTAFYMVFLPFMWFLIGHE